MATLEATKLLQYVENIRRYMNSIMNYYRLQQNQQDRQDRYENENNDVISTQTQQEQR